VAGAAAGAVAGVVGLGAGALGVSPVLAGVLSGFSVGATQQAIFNVVAGEAWYAGVAESAFIGAAAGGVAGGIVGAANPQSLPAKVLVGGVAGGGVGGGMKVATNVAAGRPWNEDLGQAIAIGATTGMVDAFTDYALFAQRQGQAGRPGDDAAGRARGGG
jgi:hypothetical protein